MTTTPAALASSANASDRSSRSVTAVLSRLGQRRHHPVDLPERPEADELAVLAHAVDEHPFAAAGRAAGQGHVDGGDVGDLVPGGEGVVQLEGDVLNGRDVVVEEGADRFLPAMAFSGLVEEGRPNRVLYDGVVGEQR